MASDERLVEHVRAGSEAAFEHVYDRHHRGILGFCRHMLGSAEEAEDAVQHTFMAAYRDLVGSEKPIQLRAWLYTIARNRCYSTLRARRERPLGEMDEPPTENLSAEVERRQDLRDLLSDLSSLPDDQRAALVLAELGAVSHEEIATVLDVPREKVKALVFQARTSLIASRKARDTSCEEIREQLANLRGGSLRRTTLRRHLSECAGCRAFRNEVALQRRALAVALPVLPTLGLKHTALAAAFGSGSAGGGAAAVGAATSTAVVAAGGGGAMAAKALVAVALVAGGTTAGITATRNSSHADRAPARTAAPSAGAAVPAGDALGRHGRSPATTGDDARAGDAQGNADRGRKTRTRSRTRGQTQTRPGHGRAVRAHGRAGAPGQPRTKKAWNGEDVPSKQRGHGRGGATSGPQREKATTHGNGNGRDKVKTQRPVNVAPAPVVRGPATPKPKPVKPARPVAPVPTAAPAPTVAPETSLPQGNGNGNRDSGTKPE